MSNMREDLKALIKELAEIYDPESRDYYISLYLGKYKEKNNLLDQRQKACQSVLTGHELHNFLKTIEDIKQFLKKNINDNVALFASHKHKFLRTIVLPVHIDNLLVVDSSPYLRPLARIHDEWESFTLVLISQNYAKIFSISLGKVEHETTLSADIMNKHKKGGWSQARFQRLRKGAINSFFSEIENALHKITDKKIVLAGPGIAKLRFRDRLAREVQNNIVGIIDININGEHKLLKEAIHLIAKREERASCEAVQHLKSEILKDGLAVYGVKETLKAAENGQVEILILEKDYKLHGWICENCQRVDIGDKKQCPHCGNKTSTVDVIEEILEFAERTNSEIEFTDKEDIAQLGHIGALLRFK